MELEKIIEALSSIARMNKDKLFILGVVDKNDKENIVSGHLNQEDFSFAELIGIVEIIKTRLLNEIKKEDYEEYISNPDNTISN